jgi:hypothetical protein
MDYQSGGGGARGCFTCKSIPIYLLYTSNSLVENRILCQERVCTTIFPFRHTLLLVSSTYEVVSISSLEPLSDNPSCSNRFGPKLVLVATNRKLFRILM